MLWTYKMKVPSFYGSENSKHALIPLLPPLKSLYMYNVATRSQQAWSEQSHDID